MKKLIFGMMIIVASNTYAEFQNIEISNFTGNYRKPDGSATATQLIIPESITSRIDIELKGVNDGYLLQYGDEEFHFESPPSFINDIDSASWSKINYTTSKNKMNMSVGFFSSDVEGSKMNVQKLIANCYKNRDHADQYGLEVLDACLTNSDFSISYFLSSKAAHIYNVLFDLPGMEGITSSEITMKNASLKIKKNSFKFSGKVDMGMSANIKIEGKTNYEVDKSRVSIRIDKAKASFLNIKSRLFDELEKSETKTFVVSKPYIYIYLK